MFGDAPAGLLLRTGPSIGPGEPDRDMQVAALLTVNPALGVLSDASAVPAKSPRVLRPSRPAGCSTDAGQLSRGAHRASAGLTIVMAPPFDQLPDSGWGGCRGSGEGAFRRRRGPGDRRRPRHGSGSWRISRPMPPSPVRRRYSRLRRRPSHRVSAPCPRSSGSFLLARHHRPSVVEPGLNTFEIKPTQSSSSRQRPHLARP